MMNKFSPAATLKRIFTGDKYIWNNIRIHDGNSSLQNATVDFELQDATVDFE